MKTKIIVTVVCAMIISMATTTAQAYQSKIEGSSLYAAPRMVSDLMSPMRHKPTRNFVSSCCETKCCDLKSCSTGTENCHKNGCCTAGEHCGAIPSGKANALKYSASISQCTSKGNHKEQGCSKK